MVVVVICVNNRRNGVRSGEVSQVDQSQPSHCAPLTNERSDPPLSCVFDLVSDVYLFRVNLVQ